VKRHKFNVGKREGRTVDGITFDSKAEAVRYRNLRTLEAAGDISDLELQPSYQLQPGFKRDGVRERAINYRADFRYRDKHGQVIVEDVKGQRTAVYKLKRKLLLYHYPDINFREVKA